MQNTLDEFELEVLPPPEERKSQINTGRNTPQIPSSPRISTPTIKKSIPEPVKNPILEKMDEENLIDIKAPNPKKPNEEIVDEFNIMLNLTDISYGVKGHNKFYQLQVLKRSGRYSLFTKWARVGAKNPQSLVEEFDTKFEAVKAFKKKFWQKTQNDWDDREKLPASTWKIYNDCCRRGG